MKNLFIAICLLTFFAATVYAHQEDLLKFTGPYLGQKPPGIVPEVFGEKLDTDEFENGGFSFTKGIRRQVVQSGKFWS